MMGNGSRAVLDGAGFWNEPEEEFRRQGRTAVSLPPTLRRPKDGWPLRVKFLERAQHYLGIPYAKKYHQPGTPDYESPLFLDCCGFIRRVMWDLTEDFGFYLGPGNQAYQYDTLPITLPREDLLKPGDLIFISGVYFDPQRKRQPHNIVHVEIWLGDGERTLGARWKRGRSQIFDSYKFISSSYGDMGYHFKSIETWLQGVCISHCPEHKWASVQYLPGRRSIFHPQSKQDELAEEDVSPSRKGDKGTVAMMDRARGSAHDCGPTSSKQLEALDLQVSTRLVSEAPKMNLGKRDRGVESGKGQDQAPSPNTGCWEAAAEGEQAPEERCEEGPVKGPPPRVPGQEADINRRASGHRRGSPSQTSLSSSKVNPEGSVGKWEKEVKSRTQEVLSLDEPPPAGPGWMNERPLDAHERAAALRLGFCWYPYYNPADHPRRASSRRERYGSIFESPTLKDWKAFRQQNTAEGELTNEAKLKKPKSTLNSSLRMSLLEEKKPEEAPGLGPFYYVGGANGVEILNIYCRSKGWQRIHDNRREDYILKWCETKFRDTYYNFREGEQLLYQIPNNKIFTTKIGLLMNLREYDRVMRKVGRMTKFLKMEDFFPETFRLDTRDERDLFFEIYREPHIWICKPTSSNQGRGIFLLKTEVEVRSLQTKLQTMEGDPIYKKWPYKLPPARIVQRYIDRPLLLEGKKFDVRSYLLIASTTPYMLFFGHGYVRLTCLNYDPRSDDLTSHLTNQYVQKKSPIYAHVKEETVWPMDRFNTYVNEKFRRAKGLPKDWVFNNFTKRMKEIMLQCFLSVKSKLDCKLGYFDLIGCDFLIDEDFKVWLLEMNANPALHTNCAALKNVIPTVVNETLDLAIEIFTKAQRSQAILPLNSLAHFVLLYNGTTSETGLFHPTKSRTSLNSIKTLQASLEKNSSSTVLPNYPTDKPLTAKGPERAPKREAKGEPPGSPEGLALLPGKGVRRNPLPMPQIQISIVPGLTCCPAVKAILRGNQVCASGNQYIIKHVPATPKSGSPKAEGGEECPKASGAARGASKDRSYATWFQQTFGAKLQAASGNGAEEAPLTSSQMLSLHLQSSLPPSFSEPFGQFVAQTTGPAEEGKPAKLAASRSCSPSLPEERKISHRGS